MKNRNGLRNIDRAVALCNPLFPESLLTRASLSSLDLSALKVSKFTLSPSKLYHVLAFFNLYRNYRIKKNIALNAITAYFLFPVFYFSYYKNMKRVGGFTNFIQFIYFMKHSCKFLHAV